MKQLRGFAILSAIFILVVLAALGAFILSISSQQQIGSALDVQGVRAYQAARAGIEWGLYQVTQDAAFSSMTAVPAPATNGLTWCTSTSASTPTLASFGFTPDTLSSFTVTVECYATAGGSGGPWVFSIRSTACTEPVSGWTATTIAACPNTSGPGPLYIERRLTVTF